MSKSLPKFLEFTQNKKFLWVRAHFSQYFEFIVLNVVGTVINSSGNGVFLTSVEALTRKN